MFIINYLDRDRLANIERRVGHEVKPTDGMFMRVKTSTKEEADRLLAHFKSTNHIVKLDVIDD